MVERIDDMPAGVIGLRASGKLTKEDYTDAAMPGELGVYEELDKLDEAKSWAAG
jgi:hypothetical protein